MKRLTHKQILGYTVGDLGINLNFQMMGFYLAYFYTDVFKIPAYHVGWLFLAARVWDAVNDPLMGYLADRTQSRWGQFRPYILFGALPLNLILLACFFTPDMPQTAKIIYAYVTYIAHGMLFTAVGLPYSSISAVMTQDQQERAVISSYRMFFAVVVALSIIILVKPFAGLFGEETTGFTVAVLLVAIFSTTLLLIAFTQSEERVQMKRESYSFKQFFPLLINNKPLLILAIAMFLNTGVWVTGNAVAMYYFKYIFKDESLFAIFFFLMLPANFLGTVVTPIITKRIGKLKAFMIGSIVVTLFYTLRHILPTEPLAVFVGISLIATFGQMMCSVTQWGMLPDTVEYGHWKNGIRSEGIPFAFFSFMQKMGLAVAGAVATWILSVTGYEPDTELSNRTLSAIEWLFNLVPAGYSLLCLVVLFFYKLDSGTYTKIIAELKQREHS
ncbi:MAG: MFS transporter [Deltaproteobacteria bacterium]|nr:MFS transporter [Deltaproteobacteria bacterium]MBN2671103.1 MFS transporter [Deltaproteobacteria bacterium]